MRMRPVACAVRTAGLSARRTTGLRGGPLAHLISSGCGRHGADDDGVLFGQPVTAQLRLLCCHDRICQHLADALQFGLQRAQVLLQWRETASQTCQQRLT